MIRCVVIHMTRVIDFTDSLLEKKKIIYGIIGNPPSQTSLLSHRIQATLPKVPLETEVSEIMIIDLPHPCRHVQEIREQA